MRLLKRNPGTLSKWQSRVWGSREKAMQSRYFCGMKIGEVNGTYLSLILSYKRLLNPSGSSYSSPSATSLAMFLVPS